MLRNKNIKELIQMLKIIKHLQTLVGKKPVRFMELSKHTCYFELDSITVLCEGFEVFGWIDQGAVTELCFHSEDYFQMEDVVKEIERKKRIREFRHKIGK